MEKHTFDLTISGTANEAQIKAKALAELGAHLTADTLKALAHVVKHEPSKVAIAKKFLGVK